MAGNTRSSSQAKSRASSKRDVEGHFSGSDQENLGLPRMIARIWGLVSAICKYVILVHCI